MDLFENPIALAREVSGLHRAVIHWQHRLRRADMDDSGPYLGKPALTTRDAFRQIRELSEPPLVRQAWERWAFFLTEARINAPLIATMAHAYRVEQHPVEHAELERLSLRELLHRTLSRPAERERWADHFGVSTSRPRRLAIEQVVRRDEIAKRAGYSNSDELTAPGLNLAECAERVLKATDLLYRELVPTRFDAWLDAALAIAADRGWPAQLTPRTIQSLFEAPEWFDGLDLPTRHLPAAIAASSFARGLYELGRAMVQASASARDLYVMAHDPYGLSRHQFGALCAHLTTQEVWQTRQLQLSKDVARRQARAMLVSELIAVRCAALALLVALRIRDSGSGLGSDYQEMSTRCLGFALPRGFAAVLPRLRANTAQRLVAKCLATRWSRRLVAEFDVDWFRNPRAIVSIRDQLARTQRIAPEPDELWSSVDEYARDFESRF
ncbi:MAG TPA: hypothetical protein VKP30_07115 [Polyangiaceae bacterium]|nr:hypothetical protein [Polyangiaceae bacterium]